MIDRMSLRKIKLGFSKTGWWSKVARKYFNRLRKVEGLKDLDFLFLFVSYKDSIELIIDFSSTKKWKVRSTLGSVN